MFKKILAAVVCMLMICAAAVPVFAGQNDDVFAGAKLDLLVDLDSIDENNGFQMRGFTASPDGKYVYGGFLQNDRHVSKIDAATGEHLGQYLPEIENDDGVTAQFNYPKGLTVDCRGYLFVGITHDTPATPYISLACVDTNVDSEGYMNEISYITEKLDGDHTGINGISAQKIGDKILVYVVTCYDKDTIRCYDVTDVKNMKLYDGFGVGGVVDYNELTGSQADPGYIAVDVDGYIYLCFKRDGSSYSKGSDVIKIEKDGKGIVKQVEIPQAYGICTAGDYVFVTTYDNDASKVVVLNKSDLSQVGELVYEDQIYSLAGCAYGGDRLYVGDHGDGTPSLPGTILVSTPLNLTRDPRETETVAADPSVTPDTTTTSTDEPIVDSDVIVIADFSDPETVQKLGKTGNNVDLTYDEENACLKVTVTGADPFFNLPMKKDKWFDGDVYNTIVINYKTDVEDVTGEIFFTGKEATDIGSNHINYYMDPTEEFADLEIDMTEDDYGNWAGLIRTLRLDPSTSDIEDEVFYIKSVSVKKGEPEDTTDPVVTEPDSTEPVTTEPDTEPDGTTAPVTTDGGKTTTSAKSEEKKSDNKTGLIIAIVAGVVVVAAAAACGIILSKKKKK